MGVNASRVRFQLDKAEVVTLRDEGQADITSTTTETAVSLNELRTATWHNKEIPHGVIAVQVVVTKADINTDETYKLELVVDDVAAMNDSPVAVAALPITKVGEYVMFVDSKSLQNLDDDVDGTSKYLAIKATVSGTAPKFNYYAWMARSVHP